MNRAISVQVGLTLYQLRQRHSHSLSGQCLVKIETLPGNVYHVAKALTTKTMTMKLSQLKLVFLK
jgi:hypothetical protein